MQLHSLRHSPIANGPQPRFCREKTRGICGIPRPTSSSWNAASSLNPFSRAPLSLQLCTFTRRYGFDAALEMGVFEPSATGKAHKLSSSAGGARHTLCRAIFQTSIADQGSLSPLELFPYLNVYDPSHRQEEAAMRAVSFVLALAAGIAAGDMSSENAAAQKQRELQSPGAFSSMADRATRSKALFFGSCQSHHRSALHELSPGR